MTEFTPETEEHFAARVLETTGCRLEDIPTLHHVVCRERGGPPLSHIWLKRGDEYVCADWDVNINGPDEQQPAYGNPLEFERVVLVDYDDATPTMLAENRKRFPWHWRD